MTLWSKYIREGLCAHCKNNGKMKDIVVLDLQRIHGIYTGNIKAPKASILQISAREQLCTQDMW